MCEGVQSAASHMRQQCIRDVMVAAKAHGKVRKRDEQLRWIGDHVAGGGGNDDSSAALGPGVSSDTATGTRFDALALVLCVVISTAGCGTWAVSRQRLHAKPNVIGIGAIGNTNWRWNLREKWTCGVGVRGGLRHCGKAMTKADGSGVITDRRTLMAQCGQREPG